VFKLVFILLQNTCVDPVLSSSESIHWKKHENLYCRNGKIFAHFDNKILFLLEKYRCVLKIVTWFFSNVLMAPSKSILLCVFITNVDETYTKMTVEKVPYFHWKWVLTERKFWHIFYNHFVKKLLSHAIMLQCLSFPRPHVCRK